MKVYKILGLMSGTSLDGLDLAYCHFWMEDDSWHFKIQETKSIDYTDSLRKELKNSINYDTTDLLELNISFGKFLGQEAANFIKEKDLKVHCIASHGHTVHHRPDLGFTLQIGSGQDLAISSGHKVVCDFRSKDISLGGQGAPLVPVGDQMFFEEYRFCLNLGGISNVSFEDNEKRIAYDIGVANMLLNYLSNRAGHTYDEGGKMARTGQMDRQLLEQLNKLEYYQKPFPKSTGYEWFREEIIPIIESSQLSIPDLLNTSVHHITQQIAIQLKKYSQKQNNSLLVTGGGAFNSYLVELLGVKLGPEFQLIIPDAELIAFKEALVFAFMGLLKTLGEVNVLASVTGATQDSSSGIIFEP